MATTREPGSTAQPALAALRPAVTAISWIARTVRVFALTVLAAALVLGLVVVLEADDAAMVKVLTVGVILLPPAVLLYLYATLRGIAGLVDRLIRSPDLARKHAEDLRAAVVEGNVLARDLKSGRRPPLRRGLGLLWRLRSTLGSVRDLVPGYQPLLLVAKPALLSVVGLAALAGAIEILLAPIVLVVAALA